MTGSEEKPAKKQEEFLERLAKLEKTRYESKGYGLVVAFIITVSFFLLMPHVGQAIWPSLLAYQEENQKSYVWLKLLGGVGLHNGVHLIGNLVCWFFYHNEFSFIERYKCNNLAWPWYEDPSGWRSLCLKSIAVLLFNGNVLMPAVIHSVEWMGMLDHFDTSIETLPDAKTLALSITFFMLVEDFFFYWAHRFLHWKVIYPYFHKMHHVHKTTVGISGEYAHPVDFIFSNMLPTSIGPALIAHRVHLFTAFVWYLIRYAENLDGHCGYDFSWSPYRLIPLSASAEMHDYHHSANIGNFASFFSVWDSIMGTNKSFHEAKKRQLQAKVE